MSAWQRAFFLKTTNSWVVLELYEKSEEFLLYCLGLDKAEYAVAS